MWNNPWTVVPLLILAIIFFMDVPSRVKAILALVLAILVCLLHAADLEGKGDAEILASNREASYHTGYCTALYDAAATTNRFYEWCSKKFTFTPGTK